MNAMCQRRSLGAALALLPILALSGSTRAAEPGSADKLIARLTRVGSEGAGNEDAARALQEVLRCGPEVLPRLLDALDGAGPAASHWLRTTFENIAERALARKQPLPLRELEMFVLQQRHAPRVRYLAYEWLARADADAPGRLLPGMLDDPAAELRRDAVAVVIARGEAALAKSERETALTTFRRALTHARDRDQVQQIAAKLEKLGASVDLAAQVGFVRQWLVLGPKSGREFWSFSGEELSKIPSPVTAAGLVLAPTREQLLAVRPSEDGSTPEVAWKSNKLRPTTATPLVYKGRVYVVNSAGILTCAEPATGEVLWQERVTGPFSASPLMANGRIYTVSESGVTSVVDVRGDRPRLLAANALEETILATPAIADGVILLRSDAHLFCVGASRKP